MDNLISSGDESETWELEFAECLDSEMLKAIVLANTLAMTEPELTATGASCVEELIAGTDFRAVIAGEKTGADPQDIAAAGEYFAGLMSCQLADQLRAAEGLEGALGDAQASDKISGLTINCFLNPGRGFGNQRATRIGLHPGRWG